MLPVLLYMGTTQTIRGPPAACAQAMPVRSYVPAEATLESMARAASQATIDAMAHAALPFQDVLKASGVGRTPGANPLFQVGGRRASNRLGWQQGQGGHLQVQQ